MGDAEGNSDDYKMIYKILECPVCLETVRPPIFMCDNGHHICNICKPRCDQCPLCRHTFTKTRNIAVEHILSAVERPCQNRSRGCSNVGNLSQIKLHERNCTFQPYECPVPSCVKYIIRAEMVSHLVREHPSWNIVTKNFDRFDNKVFISSGLFQGDFINVYDLREWGLFFLHGKKKMYGYFMYVNNLENSETPSKYQFGVCVEDSEGKRRYGSAGTVESCKLSFKCRLGQGNYLHVGYRRFKKLKDKSKNIRYKVIIIKKDTERRVAESTNSTNNRRNRTVSEPKNSGRLPDVGHPSGAVIRTESNDGVNSTTVNNSSASQETPSSLVSSCYPSGKSSTGGSLQTPGAHGSACDFSGNNLTTNNIVRVNGAGNATILRPAVKLAGLGQLIAGISTATIFGSNIEHNCEMESHYRIIPCPVRNCADSVFAKNLKMHIERKHASRSVKEEK